jgi:hypothetical protein
MRPDWKADEDPVLAGIGEHISKLTGGGVWYLPEKRSAPRPPANPAPRADAERGRAARRCAARR